MSRLSDHLRGNRDPAWIPPTPRRLLLALFATLALSVPAASAAVVKSGRLSYVTKRFAISPGHTAKFKAACPTRTRVIGGGFYNNLGYGTVLGAHSYPYDSADHNKLPEDGWAAMVHDYAKHPTVTIYAICARVFPDYIQETKTVGSGGNIDWFVPCTGANGYVTAGGTRGPFAARETVNLPDQSIDPAGTQWTGNTYNVSMSAHRVTAIAICTNLAVTYVTSGDVYVPSHTQGHAEATCPVEAPHIAGGGTAVFASSADSGNVAIVASEPQGFGSSAIDGWQGWVDDYDPAAQAPFFALASCIPRVG
jgi:hypothetical protein